MTSTHVDLRVTDARGRDHAARAVMGSGGWLVEAWLDGRSFSKRCGSWQAVERTMYWLRRHAADPPRSRLRDTVVAAMMIVVLVGATASAQVPGAPSAAVREFVDATHAYTVLHRQLENSLPRLEVTSNPETIDRAVRAMAAAIRAARSSAQPGDFFTEPLAVELRARTAGALAAHGMTPDDVRAAEAVEGIDGAAALLRVNGPFPWLYATKMLTCVLESLPPLPPELQYRIVGNTLVLIDVHADLIVDLLPHLLAETER